MITLESCRDRSSDLSEAHPHPSPLPSREREKARMSLRAERSNLTASHFLRDCFVADAPRNDKMSKGCSLPWWEGVRGRGKAADRLKGLSLQCLDVFCYAGSE